MLRTRPSLVAPALLCALVFSGVCVTARSQTTSPSGPRLELKAALLLTPDFCATKVKVKMKQGKELANSRELIEAYLNLDPARAACAELEPALKDVFASLTVVTADSTWEKEAQVVLRPRIVDVVILERSPFSMHMEMTVVLDWTATARSGKVIWVETVQGSAKTQGRWTRKSQVETLEDAMKDAAEQSARKMSLSPELRKLAP